MKLKTLVAFAVAAAFAVPLTAQAQGDKPKSEASGSAGAGASASGAEAMFKSLDKDNDGSISKEEAAGTPYEKDFAKLDKNSDGKLSPEEHAAAPRRPAAHRLAAPRRSSNYFCELRAGLTAARPSPGSKPSGKHLFNRRLDDAHRVGIALENGLQVIARLLQRDVRRQGWHVRIDDSFADHLRWGACVGLTLAYRCKESPACGT